MASDPGKPMHNPIEGRERRDLQAIFFLFGLGVMCLAPRLPDINSKYKWLNRRAMRSLNNGPYRPSPRRLQSLCDERGNDLRDYWNPY
ncbi:MAG: hypothetical protein RL673_625 [Actinomycetota bacterium]